MTRAADMPEEKLKDIRDATFPRDQLRTGANVSGTARLEVVSTCPKCGSPVYGPKDVGLAEEVSVKHTCNCSGRSLGTSMRIT